MKTGMDPKARTRKQRRLLGAVLALLFLFYYSGLLWTNLCDVAGGSDSSGYLNYAWRLRHGNLREPIQALDALNLGEEYSPLFRPIGFTWGSESRIMVPAYPPGLPFHMVFFAEMFGWKKGPYLVSPLAALVGLLLLYALSRQFGLSRMMSLAAAVILAGFPVFLFIAVQPMSDVLAGFWSMAAILAGLQSRKHSGWAWLAGASFGIGILVRPTNVFILFPLLFALPLKPKAYGKFLLGGLGFGALQIFLNIVLYGTALTTGYRGEVVAALDARDFLSGFFYYGRWLAKMLTPLVPLAGLGIMLNRKILWKDRLLLISWFAPFLVFYSIYRPHENWTFLRFFLPALPALILSALLILRETMAYFVKIVHSWPGLNRPRRSVCLLIPRFMAVLLVVFVGATEISEIKKLKLLDVNEYESVYKLGCFSAKNKLPEKSIVLSTQMSGALTYYTNLLPCLWDVLQPGQFSMVRRQASLNGYNLFALLFRFEEEGFQKSIPGRWQKIENYQFLSLWRFVPGSE
jgi:hypothetical protein